MVYFRVLNRSYSCLTFLKLLVSHCLIIRISVIQSVFIRIRQIRSSGYSIALSSSFEHSSSGRIHLILPCTPSNSYRSIPGIVWSCSHRPGFRLASFICIYLRKSDSFVSCLPNKQYYQNNLCYRSRLTYQLFRSSSSIAHRDAALISYKVVSSFYPVSHPSNPRSQKSIDEVKSSGTSHSDIDSFIHFSRFLSFVRQKLTLFYSHSCCRITRIGYDAIKMRCDSRSYLRVNTKTTYVMRSDERRLLPVPPPTFPFQHPSLPSLPQSTSSAPGASAFVLESFSSLVFWPRASIRQ